MAHKKDGARRRNDGAGVQREQSALMQKQSHARAQQQQAHHVVVGFRSALDENFIATAHEQPGHAGQAKARLVRRHLAQRAGGAGVGWLRRQFVTAHRHIHCRPCRRSAQFWTGQGHTPDHSIGCIIHNGQSISLLEYVNES